MKIGIVGYGKMGREVELVARETGHQVVWTLELDVNDGGCAIDAARLATVDVCIEFTMPSSAATNVERIVTHGGKVVCGTTGWFHALPRVREVARPDSGLVYGSNFSLGAFLFREIVHEAARRFASFPEYDCAIHEIHHAAKTDHPSGTARNLADDLLAILPGKTSMIADLHDGRIARDRLHVSSTRVGSVPGSHAVYFDGSFDTVELKHTARSRGGFARGALMAAEWLAGQSGVFGFEQVVKTLMEAR